MEDRYEVEETTLLGSVLERSKVVGLLLYDPRSWVAHGTTPGHALPIGRAEVIDYPLQDTRVMDYSLDHPEIPPQAASKVLNYLFYYFEDIAPLLDNTVKV